MSIFDIDNSKLTVQQEGRVLSAAIYEIYKEADRKRDELLKTVDKDVAEFSLPSYRDLRKEIMSYKSHDEIHTSTIVFHKPCG